MHKTTIVTGVAAPLELSNVDTDQIIPAVFLKRITRTGFEDALFHEWRKDPALALRDYGFDAVLSPRFGDIFRGNSGKQGLLAGEITEADVEALWGVIRDSPGIEATVDLHQRTATVGEVTVPFQVDDYTRWRLLEGLDDIGLTLRDEPRISAFEATRESWRPRTLPAK